MRVPGWFRQRPHCHPRDRERGQCTHPAGPGPARGAAEPGGVPREAERTAEEGEEGCRARGGRAGDQGRDGG